MGVRIAGTCYIKADGINLSIKGKAEYPMLPVIQKTVMGLAGPVGFDQRAQEPYLAIDAITDSNFSTWRPQLAAMSNGTITFEAANGTTYTLTGAWVDGEVPVNAVDGDVSIRFSGMNGVYG